MGEGGRKRKLLFEFYKKFSTTRKQLSTVNITFNTVTVLKVMSKNY